MASSSFTPIMVQLIWDERVQFVNGFLVCHDISKRRTFPLLNKISFQELCDFTYNCYGVSKQAFSLELFLWYEYNGQVFTNLITDDNTLGLVYFLGVAQFQVRFAPIQQASFTNQLLNLTASQGLITPQNNEAVDEDVEGDDDEDDDVDVHDEDNVGFDDSADELPESDDDTLEGYSVDGDISGDEEDENVPHEQGPLTLTQQNELDDGDDNIIPFNEVDEDFVYWSKETNVIQKGMVFRSKAELIYAVRLWNIRHNRELIVQDTRP